MTQFYRMTLESALTHYQQGDLTAKGLVHIYLLIKCKAGWKIKLEPKKICSQLGIQKTAFYNAISRLKIEGSIEWEAPNGIVVSISDAFRQCGKDSVNVELNSAFEETQSANAEKGVSSALSVVSSSPSSDYYQIFNSSLSDEVREKFLNFVKEKVKNFATPINDLEAWLAVKNAAGKERFSVYYKMFTTEVGEAVAPSQSWENHPMREEWINQIKERGKSCFIAQGGSSEQWEMRQAFSDWAVGHNLVWSK